MDFRLIGVSAVSAVVANRVDHRQHVGALRHGPGASLLPPAVGPRYIRGVHVNVLRSGIAWGERYRKGERQRVAAQRDRRARYAQRALAVL
jgi:hypothetical protein